MPDFLYKCYLYILALCPFLVPFGNIKYELHSEVGTPSVSMARYIPHQRSKKFVVTPVNAYSLLQSRCPYNLQIDKFGPAVIMLGIVPVLSHVSHISSIGFSLHLLFFSLTAGDFRP